MSRLHERVTEVLEARLVEAPGCNPAKLACAAIEAVASEFDLMVAIGNTALSRVSDADRQISARWRQVAEKHMPRQSFAEPAAAACEWLRCSL